VSGGFGRWSPRLLLVSAALVAAAAVILVAHRERLTEAWNAAAELPTSALGGAFLLVLSQLGLQACRLWALTPRDARLPFWSGARAFTMGEWANIFTPARAGDALKVMLLCRAGGERPISLPTATGAVLADKLVDAASLIALSAVAAGRIGLASEVRQIRVPSLVGALALAALVFLCAGLGHPWLVTRLKQWRRELGKGLAALTDADQLVPSVVFSLGAWLAEVLALRVLCAGLGFHLALAPIVLALAALNVGIGVPVTPANLGVYEGVLAFGLSRSGVPLPSAVAVAAVHHALELLATTFAGVGFSVGAACRPWGAVPRRGAPGP
jgi:uncharacterized membrane protein YbhN (UPF0104 family)